MRVSRFKVRARILKRGKKKKERRKRMGKTHRNRREDVRDMVSLYVLFQLTHSLLWLYNFSIDYYYWLVGLRRIDHAKEKI